MTTALRLDARPRVDSLARANALRVLCMDAIERAGSGHPGVPLGMADVAEVLWTRFLRHDPASPEWWDRDRFVVSDGHGSMLLYALLHLTGYDLPRQELERFRRLGSRTPGHPEHGVTPGVETTTGPRGQGLANAVGMALAERLLASEFNRPGHAVVNHRTWVFLGDGCLMEGLSHEAASLAGAMGLAKLVAIWDDNGISTDGPVDGRWRDDTPARFEAYGWNVLRHVDGHDPEQVAAALAAAQQEPHRPSLVCCRTTIGRGAPTKAGTRHVHGAPLGAVEVAAARAAMGWTAPPFEVPAEVQESWDARAAGAALRRHWQESFQRYAAAHPELAAELRRRMQGDLPISFFATIKEAMAGAAARREVVATRKASLDAIEVLAQALPELLGGSADLSSSNLTRWRDAPAVGRGGGGRYVHWGAREHGMFAALNGVALHGGFIPYAGTFLVFSDYARAALRMAALMGTRAVFVLTHDSIGVGEDGPTHQPVEHAATLRLVPGLDVWRPCDALETFVAWRWAVERRFGPTALLLSRQALAPQPRDGAAARSIERGGYVLAEAAGGRPRAVIIATGSEVQLAMSARRLLAETGWPVRVVSMPSTTVFDRQDAEYREEVLPRGVPRVAVEAGVSDPWRKYVGLEGAVVGLDRFGESGPGPELFAELAFTPERVAQVVRAVARAPRGRRAPLRRRHQGR
jgi:transketolase